MQFFHVQSKLIWLLLPALATAATRPLGSLTTISTSGLNLLTPQHLNATSIGRAAYCKHDDDPYHFISSLNNTFPDTPSLPQSALIAAGFTQDSGEYPFDCFLEIPGGIVVFEIKGEINSHLALVFEVWLSVLVFNYQIGVYECDLLDLEKDPCAFNIDKRYFKGQGGLFPKEDQDPNYIDLCVEIHGYVKIPYSRVTKPINFEKCFWKFPKNDKPDKLDEIS